MVKYCIVVHLPCTAEEYMILKDDPEYVRYQLGEVGARELSRVSELGADGFVTQTIVNRPNIAVPRVLRPLLRGKEIEFRDVRRYRHGTHTAVPFEMELAVFNSISDRVEQRARIRIANVRVDADGAVRRDDATYRKKKKKKASPAKTRRYMRRTKTKTRRTLLFRPRRASLSASLWAFSARRRARFGASAR